MAQEFLTKKIVSMFNYYFDVNHDHFITFDDFAIAVEKWRVQNYKSHDDPRIAGLLDGLRVLFQNLLKLADTNNDGKVSLDEYVAFWLNTGEKLRNGSTLNDFGLEGLAKFTFKVADVDFDGVMSDSDFRGFVQPHLNCDDALVDQSWAKLSQVGPIREALFVEIFARYFSSTDPSDPANHLFGPVF